LDTNVLSELTRPDPNLKIVKWLDSIDEDLVYLSVLTLGEIRRGIELLSSAKRRAQLEAWLESDVQIRFETRILDIDRSVADRWGALLAKSKVKGRPLPVIDGLLIATALDHNLTFVSRDTSGAIAAGVSVFNPWD
ncbi:MAG TPA: type II toxin-antitoxin system VapC family toxin, partial [Terriglobales bacterium]